MVLYRYNCNLYGDIIALKEENNTVDNRVDNSNLTATELQNKLKKELIRTSNLNNSSSCTNCNTTITRKLELNYETGEYEDVYYLENGSEEYRIPLSFPIYIK